MATEAWLRGPVEGVPGLLAPVAHALIQARDDLHAAAADLRVDALWLRPGGAASIGFHLRHIPGTLDRLFTYARGEMLNEAQLAAISGERTPGSPPATADELLARVDAAVDQALATLRVIDPDQLLDAREVGRSRLPSTLLGVLFHAAEHTQRHTGQVITTAKIIRGMDLVSAGAPAREAAS